MIISGVKFGDSAATIDKTECPPSSDLQPYQIPGPTAAESAKWEKTLDDYRESLKDIAVREAVVAHLEKGLDDLEKAIKKVEQAEAAAAAQASLTDAIETAIRRVTPAALSALAQQAATLPDAPLSRHPAGSLLAAAAVAGLSPAQELLMTAISEGNGRISLEKAARACTDRIGGCIDLISALKHAKPKMKKQGWRVFRDNNCLVAEPVKVGQK